MFFPGRRGSTLGDQKHPKNATVSPKSALPALFLEKCTPDLSKMCRAGLCRTTGWNLSYNTKIIPSPPPKKNRVEGYGSPEIVDDTSNHWTGLFMIYTKKKSGLQATNFLQAILFSKCMSCVLLIFQHFLSGSVAKLPITACDLPWLAYVNHFFGKIRFTITTTVWTGERNFKHTKKSCCTSSDKDPPQLGHTQAFNA